MESHLQHLCPRLAKKVELDVVVFGNPEREFTERFGFRLHRVRTQAVIASAPVSLELTSKIASIPADIVHIHHPNPTAIQAYLASGHKGRLVVTYHSDIVRQKILGKLISPVLERAWRRTRRFMVASPDYIESSPVLSRYRSRSIAIPHGIELEEQRTPTEAEVAAIRARFPGGLLLAVGRLVGYKGFEYLVDAMSKVAESGNAAQLAIVGVGPLKENLTSQITRLNLTGRVHLLERVDDLAPYFAAADIFVLPSIDRNEAYGFVQVEAMAYGLPVINTNLQSGVPFVSRHNETGLTVPPCDSGALAAAILDLVQDTAKRKTFGHAARERAYGEFSAEKMVERTLSVYEEVATEPA